MSINIGVNRAAKTPLNDNMLTHRTIHESCAVVIMNINIGVKPCSNDSNER